MAAPYVFSPSQVETYLSCARKWAWSRIAKIPKAENESAQLGGEVHKQLENYLAGKPLDFTHPKGAGYIAAAGVHFLPEPNSPGMAIEKEFRFTSPRTGFVWNGRKDLELDDSATIPDIEGGYPAVLDHKSTSNLRWAKTEEDLRWDVQANVYAHALMQKRGADAVDLVWVYYQTKGARSSKRTHLRVFKDHAQRAFDLIEDIATDMAKHLDAADGQQDLHAFVNSLNPTPTACGAYGGCPYQHVCKLTIEQRRPRMSSSDEVLDSLKKRAQEQDGVMGCAPEEVAAPAAMPSWLLAATKPSVVPAPEPVVYATPVVEAIIGTVPAVPSFPNAAAAFASINPPEATVEVTLPPAPAPEAPATVAEVSAAKKRGRPKKAKDPVGADANAFTTVVAPVTVAPVTLTFDDAIAQGTKLMVETYKEMANDVSPMAEQLERLADAPLAYTLYIDCAPVGIEYEAVETYIFSAKARIKNEKGLADYRFAEYGQGPGLLASATLAAVLEASPEHLVVSTRTPEGAIVATDLMAHAASVVRGL